MKRLTLIIFMLSLQSTVFSQNTCDNALNLAPGITTINVIDGSPIPQTCIGDPLTGQNAEWFTYTPVQDELITISSDLAQNTAPNTDDTRVHVFTGTCDGLVCIAGDENGGVNGFSLAEVQFVAQANTTYYIAWDNLASQGAPNADFDFETTIEVAPDCTTSYPFVENFDDDAAFSFCYTINDANADGTSWYTQALDLGQGVTPFANTDNTGSNKDDYLFSPAFSMNTNSSYDISFIYNTFASSVEDIEVIITQGTDLADAASGTVIFSQTDIAPAGALSDLQPTAYNEMASFTPPADGDYHIAFRSTGDAGFLILFEYGVEEISAGDTCDNASPLVAGITNIADINGSPIPQTCIGDPLTGQNAEWFTYTPVQDELITISSDLAQNTAPNTDDTRVHVFTGTCDGLVCVAGDENGGVNGFSLAEVQFVAQANTTYYIAWDNLASQGAPNADFDFETTIEVAPDCTTSYPFVENFDDDAAFSFCYTINDANADGTSWYTQALDLGQGVTPFANTDNTGSNKDDYLFSPAFSMNTNSSYDISFIYNTFASSVEDIEVIITQGTDLADAASGTVIFSQTDIAPAGALSDLQPTAYNEMASFTPPADGDYHIAFRSTGDAGFLILFEYGVEEISAGDTCDNASPLVAGITNIADINGSPIPQTCIGDPLTGQNAEWFTYTPVQDELITISSDLAQNTAPNTDDTRVHVFTGTCDGLVCVAGDENGGVNGFSLAEVQFVAQANTTYYIAWDNLASQGAPNADFDFETTIEVAPDCTTSYPFVENFDDDAAFSFCYTINDANADGTSWYTQALDLGQGVTPFANTDNTGSNKDDYLFSPAFSMNTNSSYDISFIYNTFASSVEDIEVIITQGTDLADAASGTVIFSQTDIAPAGALSDLQPTAYNEMASFTPPADGDYHIAFRSTGDAGFLILFEYGVEEISAGDTCDNASPLVAGITNIADINGSPIPQTCIGDPLTGQNAEWFTYTPVQDELITISSDLAQNTAPNTDDTRVHVFTGTCDGLVCVAGDENGGVNGFSLAEVQFVAQANTTYYIAWDNLASQGAPNADFDFETTIEVAPDCTTSYPFVENFDDDAAFSFCYTINDANADGTSWYTQALDLGQGVTPFANTDNTGSNKDDYLFSPAFSMNTNSSYDISFIYNTFASSVEDIEVIITQGTDLADAASGTVIFSQTDIAPAGALSDLQPTAYNEMASFTPPADGDYHIAFRSTGDAGFLILFEYGVEEISAGDTCDNASPLVAGITNIADINGSPIPQTCIGDPLTGQNAEWFTYTPVQDELITISSDLAQNTAPNTDDTRVHVFTGTCDGLVCVAGDENGGVNGFSLAEVQFVAQANTTYYIAWDNLASQGAPNADFDFETTIEVAPDCTTSYPFVENFDDDAAFSFCYTINDANADGTSWYTQALDLGQGVTPFANTDNTGSNKDDYLFSPAFSMNTNSSYDISFIYNTFASSVEDIEVIITQGTDLADAASGTVIFSQTDIAPAGALSDLQPTAYNEMASFTPPADGDYHIAFRSTGDAGFLILFEYGVEEISAGDTCDNASPLVAGITNIADINGSPIPQTCIGDPLTGQNAEWFTYTPVQDELITISSDLAQNTAPNTDDTRVHVFTGTCDGLVCVAGDENGGVNGFSLAEVQFVAQANTTYYIAWDNLASQGAPNADFDFETTIEVAPDCTTSYPFVENFDDDAAFSFCYTINDANADGTSWYTQALDLGQGVTPFANTDNTGSNKDDYLFSPAFSMNTNSSYDISFIYNTFASSVEDIEVIITQGTDLADAASGTVIFSQTDIAPAGALSDLQPTAYNEMASFTPPADGDYHIAFRSTGDAGFLILFEYGVEEISAGDTCDNASPLVAGITNIADINGSPIPQTCIGDPLTGQNAEWFTYTPVQDELITISSDLAQNAMPNIDDTRIHIFTGTCDGLVCIAGDENGGVNGFSLAEVQFLAEANTTYYIAWDNLASQGAPNPDFDFETTIEAAPDCTTSYPFVENFDDDAAFVFCYTVNDANADGNTWYTQELDLGQGITTFANTDNTGSNKDDYLFSPAFTMNTSSSYNISFIYNTFASSVEDIEVIITEGTDLADAASGTVIFSQTNITPAEELSDLQPEAYNEMVSFTPPAAGDYHIAFRSTGDAGFLILFEYSIDETLSNDIFSSVDFDYYVSQNSDLIIKANQPFTNIDLFDMSGRNIYRKELNLTQEVIDLKDLSSGVYIAKVSIGNSTTTFKFIKK